MSRLLGSRRGARPQEHDDTTSETVQGSNEGDEHRHSLSPGVPVRAVPQQGRTAAAREPCDRIPPLRDVGQWLCVPPFRVVCLYQALRMELLHCKYRTKQNKFNRKNYRWFFLCTLFDDDSSSGAGARIAILRTIFPLGMQIYKQIPRSSRRNPLPMKRINGSLLMRHEYLACALVEQMEIGKTSSGPDGVFHHPPETFDGVEVGPTMGG